MLHGVRMCAIFFETHRPSSLLVYQAPCPRSLAGYCRGVGLLDHNNNNYIGEPERRHDAATTSGACKRGAPKPKKEPTQKWITVATMPVPLMKRTHGHHKSHCKCTRLVD